MAGENIGASLVPVSGSLQPSAVPANANAPKAPKRAELQTMQANKAFAKVIVVSMSGRISRTLQSAACAARFVAMDPKEVRIMDQKARAAR
jgi:fatty acid-binding protein DegV